MGFLNFDEFDYFEWGNGFSKLRRTLTNSTASGGNFYNLRRTSKNSTTSKRGGGGGRGSSYNIDKVQMMLGSSFVVAKYINEREY